MALYKVIVALFVALVFTRIELSVAHVLKSSISCLDCHRPYDFSGIGVAVKCSNVKNLATAISKEDGNFETELSLDTSAPTTTNCQAKILGGPNQLYTFKQNMVRRVVKAHESNFYTMSKPLNFYSSCPLSKNDGNCAAKNSGFGSLKTFDLPVPPAWGLPPTSFYAPFFPIIGIP